MLDSFDWLTDIALASRGVQKTYCFFLGVKEGYQVQYGIYYRIIGKTPSSWCITIYSLRTYLLNLANTNCTSQKKFLKNCSHNVTYFHDTPRILPPTTSILLITLRYE